ncbi:MAG TPA: 3'(2'),5'-bisphosphate nucleotidase [Planctomycetaceae bacterium]|jgi:3'(2'), 5'-bisphosphate nucleotidase|nr:3'(2'),5'-bisphosphate nucleotidase [Planctomycetaceae bacterium]
MASKWGAEQSVALDAVRAASRICRDVQSKIEADVFEKEDRSPVTVADFASQAAICRLIGAAFPDDPIIGEEESGALRREENRLFLDRVLEELRAIGVDATGEQACDWIDRGCEKKYAPRFWTLDPIDGTKGFLRQEQYAVSLALLIEGRIELALLGCPNLNADADPKTLSHSDGRGQGEGSSSSDDLQRQPSPRPSPGGPGEGELGSSGAVFYAVRGGGAWVVPLEDTNATPVRVHCSHLADPVEARFCESVESSHTSTSLSARVAAALGIHREPLRMDSQAKYAIVARGDAEIYMRLPAKYGYKEKIWDHAGGVLLVEEAGGVVSDVMGRPLEFNHGYELLANRGIIAANRELHSRVIAALDEIYKTFPAPQGPLPEPGWTPS